MYVQMNDLIYPHSECVVYTHAYSVNGPITNGWIRQCGKERVVQHERRDLSNK